MSNTLRKIIAILCGFLLAAGIVIAVYTKDKEIIGMVTVYGVIYLVYLLVLSKHLKKTADTDKKSPLRRR